MCGCEPGFTCEKDRGTPRDPWYWLKEQPSEDDRQELFDDRQQRPEDVERA